MTNDELRMTSEILFNASPVIPDLSYVPSAFTAYSAQHLVALNVITLFCVFVV
jgi:hypothetical protein